MTAAWLCEEPPGRLAIIWLMNRRWRGVGRPSLLRPSLLTGAQSRAEVDRLSLVLGIDCCLMSVFFAASAAGWPHVRFGFSGAWSAVSTVSFGGAALFLLLTVTIRNVNWPKLMVPPSIARTARGDRRSSTAAPRASADALLSR